MSLYILVFAAMYLTIILHYVTLVEGNCLCVSLSRIPYEGSNVEHVYSVLVERLFKRTRFVICVQILQHPRHMKKLATSVTIFLAVHNVVVTFVLNDLNIIVYKKMYTCLHIFPFL